MNKYKNTAAIVLVLLTLILSGITSYLFNQLQGLKSIKKEFTLKKEKLVADSLLLNRYQKLESELIKVLSKYDSSISIFNENKSLSSTVENLLQSYLTENNNLKKQTISQKDQIKEFASNIENLKVKEIVYETKLQILETDKEIQTNKLDSILIELGKVKVDLADNAIDSLTLISPKGNKIFFYGRVSNKIPSGFGVGLYEGKGYYVGEWKGNLRSGMGKHIYKDGSVYEGYFENDLRNGYGVYYYHSGEVYKGNWKDDLMDGSGEIISPNGKSVKGTWSAGKLKVNDVKRSNGAE